MPKGIKYNGNFRYVRDFDTLSITAKFSVSSEAENAPPVVLGAAYDGCIGQKLPAACTTCAKITPRYFNVTVLPLNETESESHKVPVGDRSDLLVCYNALNATGQDRCLTYHGENWRNIHVLVP